MRQPTWGDCFVLCLFTASVVATLAGIAGREQGRSSAQREAVKAGVARWAADPETGAVTFEWCNRDGASSKGDAKR